MNDIPLPPKELVVDGVTYEVSDTSLYAGTVIVDGEVYLAEDGNPPEWTYYGSLDDFRAILATNP